MLGALLLGSWRMEVRLRQARQEQAVAVADRLLQRAPASRAAFDALAAARRGRILPGGAVDAGEVGWLEAAVSPMDRDLVVEDRLERASRAEFVAGDPAGAAAQLDALLAAPLIASIRLEVVHAAAWQAVRAGAQHRLASLRAELDALLEPLQPVDLARPELARVVAGAARLPRTGERPQRLDALLPYLPPELFASVPLHDAAAAAHAAQVERRRELVALQGAWQRAGTLAPAGFAVADDGHLLWWFAADEGDAVRDAALVTPAEWCGAVSAASYAGSLPELPAPYALDPAPTTAVRFADVPGVRGIAELATSRAPEWLQPALQGALLAVLLVAFALAVAGQLRAARREVEAARLQAQFLTTVTHELKTPLAGIHLLGEMLAEGRANGRETEYYRLLVGEAGRLAMLIDNVLDLGRLERGERRVELRPVDVGEVVAETLTMFAPVAERDGLALRFGGARPGLTARVDRAAFVQALVAVLDNARKYGAGGGVIEVDCALEGGAVRVAVRDHGPGVPAGERERVFERFVRGTAHRHGSTPGVGIGLFLARSLMRRQGCDLWHEEPRGGGPGAAFVFQLPMEDAA